MATKSKTGDTPVNKAAKPAAKTSTTAKTETAAVAAVEKKPAPRKAPADKKPAVKTAPAQSSVSEQMQAIPVLTPDQRRYYVEVAAFYIAERRGFHGNSEMNDWVQAEAEIDRLVREGFLKP